MPSPRLPPLVTFPSSPSSVWSCSHGQPSPLTPDSYFSPVPAIVSPDEFALQMDVGPAGSQPPFSIPPDAPFLSTDDPGKVQVFLRNKGRWGNTYSRLESSPPRRPRDARRVLPDTNDDFSWEATHSALMDATQLPDPSRCSLLIHEVSLLVGLTADDEHSPSDEPCYSTSKQVHDILPLNITPTKSLTPRKHDPSLPNSSLHNQSPPLVGPRGLARPIPRHKSSDAVRPPHSPHRRHGQVFQFEPLLGNEPPRNASGTDGSFCYPRAPPPRPTPKPVANRCSSLDRLEYSLLKLEAHAPHNHRKSRSEGRPFDCVLQKDHKRPHPSLPPSRRLRQQQSCHEILPCHPSRPGHAGHLPSLPPPLPRTVPPPLCIPPRPAVSLDDDLFEEDVTPNSFMDMDIPHAEEADLKRRTSSRQAKNKEKVKSLVSIAKRVSRGVIAWGKNITGKAAVAAQETDTIQNVHI